MKTFLIALGVVIVVSIGAFWFRNHAAQSQELVVPPSLAATLPPDPGQAGKQTLAGIDSDHDGVRDDVQRYIAVTYPNQLGIRAALRQVSISSQVFILNWQSDPSTVLSIVEDQRRALRCLDFVYSGDGFSLWEALKAQMLDTKARSLAYISADAKLSGHFFTLINPTRADCTFDPANPPN